MGMQMHLVVNGRIIPLSAYYDSLQDSKSDFPWTLYEVWVEKGSLYAEFRAPDEPRYYGTRINKGR